jgi:hypothetical protein
MVLTQRANPRALNGLPLWTDVDKDTYIVSDTDDTIQLFVGDAEIAEFDATSITFATDLVFLHATPEIRGGDADGELFISPSTTNALGGNIVLYSQSHASKPNDIEFRTTAALHLSYDDSADLWTMGDGDDLNFGDDQQIRFGDADDVLMKFNGNQFVVSVPNEQPFSLENTTDTTKARFNQQTKNTQGVAQVSVQVMDFNPAGSNGMLAMVVGHLNTGADTAFLDLILCPEKASGTPTVIAATNTRGTPAARTYDIGGERELKMLVAANTYDVSVHCISGAPSPL